MVKKIFAVGMACLLALSLAGCYEYRGPYTRADVEEYLTGRYPDETINIRQKAVSYTHLTLPTIVGV